MLLSDSPAKYTHTNTNKIYNRILDFLRTRCDISKYYFSHKYLFLRLVFSRFLGARFATKATYVWQVLLTNQVLQKIFLLAFYLFSACLSCFKLLHLKSIFSKSFFCKLLLTSSYFQIPYLSNNKFLAQHKKKTVKQVLKFVWPIELHEFPKFFSITFLMFCILWIQNLVRALKDTIVTTMIGPETISFLKFWGVMPFAFLATILYVKLVNKIRGQTIFYIMMSIFIGFFAIFAFYLFPNYESLHMNKELARDISIQYNHFKWFVMLLSNWSFSLFYIIAELWHNIIIALLFWQFVNTITDVETSKRFYPLFALFAQTGLYFSGEFLTNLDALGVLYVNIFCPVPNEDVLAVKVILSSVVFAGAIAIFLFWLINNRIINKHQQEMLKFSVKKSKMSFVESIKMVFSSKYIMLISLLLICYGMSINLVEGPWKAKATAVYNTPKDFAMFVGNYLKYTGIVTISFVLLCSGFVRFFGWFATAIITPIVFLVSGVAFFLISNFASVAEFAIGIFASIEPASLAITIGAVQNVFGKSSKYTLFDTTKEMAYVPLDPELKSKGKAAADILGSKIGKSGSSLIQFMIFIIFPYATYDSISMYLMVFFIATCLIWIAVVYNLNKEYTTLIIKKNAKC